MLLPESIELGKLSNDGVREHENLLALRAFWESKKTPRGLPSKADFPPQELKQWLGHILLVDVDLANVRFRIRLMGVDLVHYAGENYTGRWIDECFTGEKLEMVLKPYLACIASKSPTYDCRLHATKASRRSVLHRQYLPCAQDGVNIDTILGCAYVVDVQADSGS